MEISHRTIELFPTLVHGFGLDGLVDTVPILDRITELRGGPALTDLPETGSGQFEWMSQTDLHRDPAFGQLMHVAGECARTVLDDERWMYDGVEVTECWANISTPGGSHRSHAHPNSLLSGVWFVQSPEGSGQLEFRDPRVNGWLRLERVEPVPANSQTVNVSPTPGLMLMFPSWLGHMVGQNTGAGERVSVAFNVMPTGQIGQPTASFTR